ncbi:hypothetical protein GCM10020220_083970 [Nonomuraea rubra]
MVVGNDKVMITDTVYADVDYLVWELCRSPDQSLAPGPRGFPDCEAEAGVGPWRLHGPGAGRWYFELAADPAGTWDEVTLELPPGWLRATDPAAGRFRAPASDMAWTLPAGRLHVAARHRRAKRDHDDASSGSLPEHAAAHLCDLAILLLPVIWTGTRSRGRKRHRRPATLTRGTSPPAGAARA